MNIDDEPPARPSARSSIIGLRVTDEQKDLIEQAAEREGLQVTSFFLMILVRLKILPESALGALKRKPVPFYNALHGILGVLNNIGGNFKQLSKALQDIQGLSEAHASVIRAAEAVTDTMQGRPLPVSVNLYTYQGKLSELGYLLNDISRSVNKGRPTLDNLGSVLISISAIADEITAALTGQPVQNSQARYLSDLADLTKGALIETKNLAKSEVTISSDTD